MTPGDVFKLGTNLALIKGKIASLEPKSCQAQKLMRVLEDPTRCATMLVV